MQSVLIELPDIKAVSRNQTTGHFIKYWQQLELAERWMMIFGKAKEYHFTVPVDVDITAYYDVRGRHKIADTPNIDDKIFTDVLMRWKQQGKGKAIERPVWFIEDDNPTYLHTVTKRSLPGDRYLVLITIKEATC